jgi:solute carrier family 35 protein E1
MYAYFPLAPCTTGHRHAQPPTLPHCKYLTSRASRLLSCSAQAIATHGAGYFYGSLLSVGLLYHLYNQFAFNTLARVTPVSHGVCNVVKRIVIIATSVVFFGNKLTMQTKIGTAVALLGTWLYTEAVKVSKAPAKPKAA